VILDRTARWFFWAEFCALMLALLNFVVPIAVTMIHDGITLSEAVRSLPEAYATLLSYLTATGAASVLGSLMVRYFGLR